MSTVMSTERGGALSRDLPVTICRSASKGKVTAVINEGGVDRYGTVIVPAGAQWNNFMRAGPAVLWEHGKDVRGRMPVAHCDQIRLSGGKLVADMTFKSDKFAQEVYQQYRDQTLRAFSVDFQPDSRSTSAPTREEVRANPSWANAHTVYRSWELTGFSAVSYPGNSHCVATEVRSMNVNTGVPVSPELAQVIADVVASRMIAEHPDLVRSIMMAKQYQRANEAQHLRNVRQLEQDSFLEKIRYMDANQQRVALRAFQEAQARGPL